MLLCIRYFKKTKMTHEQTPSQTNHEILDHIPSAEELAIQAQHSQEHTVSRGDKVFDALSSIENVTAQWVQTGRPLTLVPEMMPIMDEKVNNGTSHALRAIIEAGDELFGIVQVSTAEGARRGESGDMLITRFADHDKEPGARAQLVAVIKPGTGIMFGRNFLEKSGAMDVNEHMSKVHFGLALSEDGKKIALSDEKSTNGTRIIASGVGRSEEVEAVLGGFEVWSVPTEQARLAIDASKHE